MANQTKPSKPSGKVPLITKLGVIFAILIPPIGAVLSVVALRKTRRNKLPGWGHNVFGIVWGTLFTLPFLFFIWVIIALGGLGLHSNDATKAAEPVMTQLDKIGGHKLCDNGDPGYGIDNWAPWYDV